MLDNYCWTLTRETPMENVRGKIRRCEWLMKIFFFVLWIPRKPTFSICHCILQLAANILLCYYKRSFWI